MQTLISHYLEGTQAGSERLAIIHCRLGHGRTGTTLSTFSRLMQIYHGQDTDGQQPHIDLMECIGKLRAQRMGLMEMCDQFLFVLNFLQEPQTMQMLEQLKQQYSAVGK